MALLDEEDLKASIKRINDQLDKEEEEKARALEKTTVIPALPPIASPEDDLSSYPQDEEIAEVVIPAERSPVNNSRLQEAQTAALENYTPKTAIGKLGPTQTLPGFRPTQDIVKNRVSDLIKQKQFFPPRCIWLKLYISPLGELIKKEFEANIPKSHPIVSAQLAKT